MSAPTLSNVSCKYGAPMGRHSHAHPASAYKVYVQRVHLDSGGYDRGGAYWGHGQRLYWACDATCEFSVYLRAHSREHAIDALREDYPEITFYRGDEAVRVPNTIKLPDGRRVVCKVWDNGGATFDRYTAIFRAFRGHGGKMYWPGLGMSEDPFHPQGFGQHFELTERPQIGGKRIEFTALPEQVQKCILQEFAR